MEGESQEVLVGFVKKSLWEVIYVFSPMAYTIHADGIFLLHEVTWSPNKDGTHVDIPYQEKYQQDIIEPIQYNNFSSELNN